MSVETGFELPGPSLCQRAGLVVHSCYENMELAYWSTKRQSLQMCTEESRNNVGHHPHHTAL